MIENEGSSHKKGLNVYSEHGMGTCFSFCFKNDLKTELEDFPEDKISKISLSCEKKEQNLLSLPSSSDNKRIENRNLFHNSKEEILISSIENEEINNKILSNNSLEKSRKQSSINSEEIISKWSMNSNLMPKDQFRDRYKFPKKEKETVNTEINSFIDCPLLLLNDCKCTRVLIVDDVPFNIEACRRILNKLGISSDSASNGLEAVEQIANLLNRNEDSTSSDKNINFGLKKIQNMKFCNKCKFYKLILMDVDMPIKNGIEATEEILNLLKNTDLSVSIVGLSAFDQIDIVRRGKEAGMCEFITKPIQAPKIKELILKYVFSK